MTDFMKCALIRALKTVCQTAVATIGAASVISEVDWMMVLSASALAGVLSLLTAWLLDCLRSTILTRSLKTLTRRT